MSKINKKLQLENKITGKTLAACQLALHRPGLAQPWHQYAPDVLWTLKLCPRAAYCSFTGNFSSKNTNRLHYINLHRTVVLWKILRSINYLAVNQWLSLYICSRRLLPFKYNNNTAMFSVYIKRTLVLKPTLPLQFQVQGHVEPRSNSWIDRGCSSALASSWRPATVTWRVRVLAGHAGRGAGSWGAREHARGEGGGLHWAARLHWAVISVQPVSRSRSPRLRPCARFVPLASAYATVLRH